MELKKVEVIFQRKHDCFNSHFSILFIPHKYKTSWEVFGKSSLLMRHDKHSAPETKRTKMNWTTLNSISQKSWCLEHTVTRRSHWLVCLLFGDSAHLPIYSAVLLLYSITGRFYRSERLVLAVEMMDESDEWDEIFPIEVPETAVIWRW